MSYWDRIAPYWDKVDIYEDGETFLRGYRVTPEVERNLLCAHWCVSEVLNGGFGQFFFNPTGVLAPEAIVGFRGVGCDVLAEIVEEACQALGEPYPRDREIRMDAAGELDFDALNERFFQGVGDHVEHWQDAADAYAASAS